MSEIKTLFLLELKSLFGINKALHTKDKKEIKRNRLLIIAYIFLGLLTCFYVGALVFGLIALNASTIAFTYLSFIASALILFFGIFSAGGKMFGQKGYDILASMPIKTSSIVISRVLILYFTDLIFALLVMLPGTIIYGIILNPSPIFYLLTIVLTLFIPLIPLVISLTLGTLVYFITSRMKKKSIISSLLMVAIVLVVMLSSFSLGYNSGSMNPEDFKNFVNGFTSTINSIYIPSIWFNNAIINLDILSLIYFITLSLGVSALITFIIVKFFTLILNRLSVFNAKHDYKVKDIESRGVLKALTIREAKRYFSSSIYVTNTIIGPILATIMAVATCFTDMSTITSGIPLQINVKAIMPFLLSAIFCMMTTSSVSISMEGKEFWAIKSLPIKSKTLFDSKILFNLLLMLPFYLVSLVALFISLKPNIFESLFLILIPLTMMIFVVVLGITVNLKFYSFDWDNEASVVKQSTAAFLGGFAGFFIGAILLTVTILVPSFFINLLNVIVLIVLWALIVLTYTLNNKKKLEDLV